MCEPISDPMRDVVVDFLMSKWSNIHIDYEGSLVLVRLPGTLVKLLFDDVGVWVFGKCLIVDYNDPLFFKKLESWLNDKLKLESFVSKKWNSSSRFGGESVKS